MLKYICAFLLVYLTGMAFHAKSKTVECRYASVSIPENWELMVRRDFYNSHIKYKNEDVAVSYRIYSEDFRERILLCKITWGNDLYPVGDEDVLPLAVPFIELLGGGNPVPSYDEKKEEWRVDDRLSYNNLHRRAYIRRGPSKVLILITITNPDNDNIDRKAYDSWKGI